MQWERAVGYCRLRLAQVIRDRGRAAQSRKHYEVALQIGEKWGELLLQEMVLIDLALLSWCDGDDEAALDHAARARDLAIRLDLQLDQAKMDDLIQTLTGESIIDEREEVRVVDGQLYRLSGVSGARGLI